MSLQLDFPIDKDSNIKTKEEVHYKGFWLFLSSVSCPKNVLSKFVMHIFY